MKTELDSFVLKTEKESIASQGSNTPHRHTFTESSWIFSVSIPRLQRDLVEAAAAKASVTRRLGNMNQLKLDKQ